ncbi:TonB-dependent receptor domain-containing protein [Ketogulonicigenium vulgare]|uniref:Heme acquisition protein hasR n=1 Tax=Ketogulonicigenium vulgare (strain WSH-001) TaxID=759362 RepID=F9Y6B2_KETVW|nr:TonB-dependent receptor [Ketogulonicigenium vulgare]ADO43850.1 heme acquisition protein hasR [Ketogulonicigenium vulgare Y25]AEM42109.1 Heme acquisition protein hasR [Ketogulonicigenium vulgare WSH-001]ALJ79737.1 heme acquisition protein hasR [Ketogulonicigenium vulgare]ANW32660.1 heme acquisition protein hasR [Ketogulonicigenium vulgare]AOZ55885.1 heme acquisition protein hasR [Ketogulonicigenium vulgare]
MNNRIRLINTTAIALGVALLAVPAVAQDSATNLGRIVIGYSEDGTPVYAGENTTILEGSAVTAQGGTARIDDVLRQVPGVMTNNNEAGQPGVSVAIRGLSGNGRVATDIEGIPQNYRFNPASGDGESYAYVEPAFVSGITVTRGALVTTGGAGLAGSVNFRLLRAEDLVDGEGFGGFARLSYGTADSDFTRTLGAGYVSGQYSVMAAITKRTSDETEDGEGTTIANSSRDTQAVMARLGYAIDAAQSIDFLVLHNEASFGANSYYQDMNSDIAKLSYRLSSGDLIDLSASVYYSFTGTENVGSLTGSGSFIGRRYEVETYGGNLSNTSVATVGSFDLTSTNGLEFNFDEIGGNNGGLTPVQGEGSRVSLFSENVFVNGPWELTGAVRLSQYKVEGDYVGGTGSPIASQYVNIDETSIDPKFTIAYQSNDWLQPYLSLYQTSRAPTAQETLMDTVRDYSAYGMGIHALIGNPNLEAETARGGELGFNIAKDNLFTAGDSLNARVAYYILDVDNYITNVTTTVTAGTLTTYQYVNIDGTTRTEGLEIEATYESDLISAVLSYTDSDSDIPDGSAYDLQPSHTYAATVAGHFLNGALTTGVTYSYTSGGTAFSTKDTTESYGLWDVFASYDVTDAFSVTAKVSNATDEVYVPWGIESGNGAGRNVYLGAQMRF